MASFTAAGTAFATHGEHMIPFYVFYSMFGLQRTGDQVWAFGDTRGHGFLLGATAGRTTLNGEGLQHEDGHSHILATVIPNIRAYDPAYAYELAAIVRDGIDRMYSRGEDVFYYVTIYNENYVQPPKPAIDGIDAAIVKGIYRLAPAPDADKGAQQVRLVGSGSILQQVLAAQALLAEKFGIAAEVYSAPSFQQLRRDALDADRWNRLHPDARKPRVPYVSQVLPADGRPIIAASDWMKAWPDMVARWLPDYYLSLGTDGFGRSDTRDALRSWFEIDAPHIAAATLVALARCGDIPAAKATRALTELGIDPEKIDPLAV
jgi:pyruvate dehydrogenase E1 component